MNVARKNAIPRLPNAAANLVCINMRTNSSLKAARNPRDTSCIPLWLSQVNPLGATSNAVAAKAVRTIVDKYQ